MLTLPVDEQGVPNATDAPVWVTTDEQYARWRTCVELAEALSGQPDGSPEVMMLAGAFYHSKLPTSPGDPPPSQIDESLHVRFDELLHPRGRRGRWRRKDVSFPKLPPATPGVTEQEMARYLEHEPRPSDMTREVLGDATSTADIYRMGVPASPGTFREVPYDRLRTEGVHDPIAAELLADKKPPRHRPLAIFMAGGPASGKTTFLKSNPKLLPKKENTVHIDADAIMKMLPEWKRLHDEREDPYAAKALHDEAGDLAARIAHEAAARGLNVVIDGTGDGEPGDFPALLSHFRDTHNVDVIVVNTPTETAVRQNIHRGAVEGDRFVPTARVREQHRKVSVNFVNEISKMPWLHAVDVYDAAHGHVAAMKNGGMVPLHEQGYREFIEKAAE